MIAQASMTLVLFLSSWLLFAMPVAFGALWGGVICLLAHAWSGFQLWLSPANRLPRRMATAAIRAEVGKIVIILLLLAVTFSKVPATREPGIAAMLLAGFFLVQLAGWIWLARAVNVPAAATGEADSAEHDDQ